LFDLDGSAVNAKPNKYPIGIGTALLAAILFGLSTPLAKLLISDIEPVLLAGLLYAGSGIGLSLWLGMRRLFKQASNEAPLRRADIPWLSAAVFFCRVRGPGCFMSWLVKTLDFSIFVVLNAGC